MYRLNDDDIAEQIRDLPADSLLALAEVRATLEVAPWSGNPARADNPDAAIRFMTFGTSTGSGVVYYLVLEEQRRVDLSHLIWLG